MPTFSIIVPIYNAEKTLHRCLDSLRSQTYTNFEVHMVENGSQDYSRAICQEYSEKDVRFLLHVSEENCGPSGARNIGLDHAQGSYIAFLDSDDYVDPDYLEVLCHAFANIDVVFFGYHQISTDGQFLGEHIPEVIDNSDYYDILLQLLRQDLFGYTWIKVFRREVISKLRFSLKLNLLEDEVFACEALTQPCKIAVIPKAILNYVTGNPGSLIGRTHQDYCRKVDASYKAWKKLLNPYKNKEEALMQIANAHVLRCMYYGFERDVDVKAFFEDLADTEFFLDGKMESEFAVSVGTGNFRKLAWMRMTYRLKNRIAKLLKR